MGQYRVGHWEVYLRYRLLAFSTSFSLKLILRVSDNEISKFIMFPKSIKKVALTQPRITTWEFIPFQPNLRLFNSSESDFHTPNTFTINFHIPFSPSSSTQVSHTFYSFHQQHTGDKDDEGSLKNGSGSGLSKKQRKARTAFTDHQLQTLEKTFERQKYLSVQDRMELANKLGLSDTQVKTWYQNRRLVKCIWSTSSLLWSVSMV